MEHVDVVEDSEPEREQRRRYDGDESDSILQLSQFAYKTTHSSRAPDPGPSRPAASLVRKEPPNHLSDPQLARLSKCISCGLEWISRKTSKQKRTHINQCARKHALDGDTVRLLVEKEIAISFPTQNTSSSHVALDEITLMDSVIPTGPVKKAKRQQVLPTVKSLPETRDSILNRARDILGLSNDQADSQPTQQFGRSGLARRKTQGSNHPTLLDVLNGSVEEPCSTQPFRASSLRTGAITVQQTVNSSEESSFLQFDAVESLFVLDSVLSSNCRKRPASSPPSVCNNSESRSVKRRFQ